MIIKSGWYAAFRPVRLGPYNTLQACEQTKPQPIEDGCDLSMYLNDRTDGSLSADQADLRFTYVAKVKNLGRREVRAVYWECEFLDRSTGDLAYRHSFQSEIKIGPGDVGLLRGSSTIPPTPVVEVDAVDKELSDLYVQRVRIRQVAYAYDQGIQGDRPGRK